MSHITTIKTQIKDLSALKEACLKLDLQLNEGQTKYKWWGSTKKSCQHAINIPGSKNSYEIGINEKDGVYVLNYDPHMGGYGIEERAGKKLAKLTEAYTQVVALKEASKFAQAQGWSVTHEFDKDTNETVIRLRKF